MTFVYLLTFSNKKQYVGVRDDPNNRIKEHKLCSSPVGRALKKYSFTLELVFEGDRPDCFSKEIELISALNSLYPYGYNRSPGGEFVTFTPEVRSKISLARSRPEDKLQRQYLAKTQWEDPEFRANNSAKAKAQWSDPEFRKFVSEKAKLQRARELGK